MAGEMAATAKNQRSRSGYRQVVADEPDEDWKGDEYAVLNLF